MISNKLRNFCIGVVYYQILSPITDVPCVEASTRWSYSWYLEVVLTKISYIRTKTLWAEFYNVYCLIFTKLVGCSRTTAFRELKARQFGPS